jgi:uncharacterized protein YunC (DUF1805 family)
MITLIRKKTTIISCGYLNLSLADEHVGDVTIPTHVIEFIAKTLSISVLKWQIIRVLSFII